MVMVRRRVLLRAALAAPWLALARGVGAEDVAVPIALQVELTVKVAAYDKHFVARAGERARVLIFAKGGDDLAGRTAKALVKELASYPTIAGLPHDDEIVGYESPTALAAACKKRRAAIVYLTPGLGSALPAIRAALDGVDVLSVTAVADHVPKGAVLGFDLVSGKTTLLVNLAQAKKQNVEFKVGILKMMKVVES